MAIALDHHLIKEILPVFFFLLYLVSLKCNKIKVVYWIFLGLQIGVIVCFPLYDVLLSSGLIVNSWRLKISFLQYVGFSFILVLVSFYRTRKIQYSFTLSMIITSSVGYLHEIPRYLKYNGLQSIIRLNKYSPLIIDLQIICVILIPIMLMFRKIKIDLKIVLSWINYMVYGWVYYHYFDPLIAFRRSSVLWIWIPHIVMFRLPIMIFFICLVSQINSSEAGFLWWLDWIIMDLVEDYPGFEETSLSSTEWASLPFDEKKEIWDGIKKYEGKQ